MGGKYSRGKKKNGSGFIWGVLVGALVTAAIMLAIFLPKLANHETMESGSPTQTTAANGENGSSGLEQTNASEPEATGFSEPEQTTEPGMDASAELISDIQIETPYCVLHYPMQWSGNIRIVSDEQPEKYSVTIVGLIGDHETELFAIVFGESTEMPIGTFITEDGTELTVRLNIDMFTPDDSWTEEEISKAYEMIDDSNYLIEKLAELKNFQ